jgi:hypothetical protein
VRDGLKPVHRRVLFAMHELGNDCIQALQEVRARRRRRDRQIPPARRLGVYDAMVRMAQPFSMRYMLIDGQGNFGSVDGDRRRRCATPKCACRARAELLADIDKETVDFVPTTTSRAGAGGAADARAEPARQRRVGHRGRHGDQHPAAQPRRGRQRLLALLDDPEITLAG